MRCSPASIISSVSELPTSMLLSMSVLRRSGPGRAGLVQIPCLQQADVMPVSACFGPVFDHSPVDSRRVGSRQALQRLLQIAESRKIFKIVRVRIKDCSLVRKVMFLCPLGDNGFQCTLNGLPHQVIAGFGMPGIQQNLCITAEQFRQFLQVISIHWLASLSPARSVPRTRR